MSVFDRAKATLGGRHVYSVADQVVSSLTNALLPLTLAGLLSPEAFGFFVTSYSVFALLIVASRGAFCIPISLKAGDRNCVRVEAGSAATVAALMFPLVALLILAAPLLAGGPIEPLYVGFAAATCCAIVQDILRYSLVALDSAKVALVADLVWLAFALGAFVLRFVGEPHPLTAVLVWGAGALVSLTLVYRRGADFVAVRSAVGRIREESGKRSYLFSAAIVGSASVSVTAVLVARLAGPQVSGALAGAGQMMAPVNVSIALIDFAVLAESARRGIRWSYRAFRICAVALALLALLWTAVISQLPTRWGMALLGETWPQTVSVIPVFGAMSALVCVGASASALLNRIDRTRWNAVLRYAQAILRVGVAIPLALIIGSTVSLAAGEAFVAATFAVGAWVVAARERSEVTPAATMPAQGPVSSNGLFDID